MRKTLLLLFVALHINPIITASQDSADLGSNSPSYTSANDPKVEVKGIVQEKASSNPLEFATVSLYSADSVLIGGGMTDAEGTFSIKTAPQSMYAVVDFLGYDQKYTDIFEFSQDDLSPTVRSKDIGVIIVAASGIELDGVEVRAELSETQFSLDKRVFNVGKDLANRGGSAEDILDNVPSITVDIEGQVSLRGNTGVRILIDGRPSSMVGAGNANGLKQIPANMIERVEVITNPSARYEAEGVAGIINIILKKDKRSGFNGALDLSAGYPLSSGAGVNLNYRKGKINWFANYGINYRQSPGVGSNYQEISLNDTLFITDQYRESNRTSLSNNVRLGIDYYITEKQRLTGALIYRTSKEDNLTTQEYYDYLNEFPANFLGLTKRTDDGGESENSLQYSLNYNREFSSRNHRLTASVQFESDLETENSDYFEEFISSEGTNSSVLEQRSENEEGEKQWLFQADYVHPLGEGHQYEFGLRSSFRDIGNHYLVEEWNGSNWENLMGLSNDFDYNENIYAAYGQYGNKFGVFSFQLGLRFEYSDVITELIQTEEINPRTYADLFPSAFFNYELSEANAFQISYSRRIRRPNFWNLNPFFSFSDSRNFFAGNPDLDPEYTHSFDMNYLRFWDNVTFNSGIFYRYSTGVIERIKTVFPDGSSATQPENLATRNDYGFEFVMSYTALKWMRLDGNLNLFRSKTDGTNLGSTFASDTYTWNSRLTSKFTFWKGSDLQIRANYRAPRELTQGRSKSFTSIDVGWSKDFLASKDLTLTLSIRDLLNSRKWRFETFGDNFYSTGEFQWRSRSINVNLNYRINQQKRRGPARGSYGGEGDFIPAF